MSFSPTYQPAPCFHALGRSFADPVAPAAFPELRLRYRNECAAASVGLGSLDDEEWTAHLGRLEPLPRNLERPLALRYHGHQFRHYNSQLGDGRGFLHAQLLDGQGRVLDLGTKGSGTTPWSRGGDGRLTLKGAVREVLATEMLEALGVYTSKTLSVFETGERLVRYDEPSPTRSAVLVRLSHSHIRFGSFQRHLYNKSHDDIRRLLEFSLDNYLPELAELGPTERPRALLEETTQRSARLVATWTLAGFVHGVLNTDNMNITGESFDYGPWRFIEAYDPSFTAAYFDHGGLYAFGRQAEAVHWNLCRLAECLLPLSLEDDLGSILEGFRPAYAGALAEHFVDRMGLRSRGSVEDGALMSAAFGVWTSCDLPFERLFFDWWGGMLSADRASRGPISSAYSGEAWQGFQDLLQSYEAVAPERLDAPYFEGEAPCTMLIDEMEAIWAPIAASDDWSLFYDKINEIRQMGASLGLRARPK